MSAILKAVQRLFMLLIKVIGNLAGPELPALVMQEGEENVPKNCYFVITCAVVPQEDLIINLLCLKLRFHKAVSSVPPVFVLQSID